MLLISGLVVFLGVHSIRIFADDWRSRQQVKWGKNHWRVAYAALSLLGFFLIVWGFGVARQSPVQFWNPPTGLRHLAGLVTLLSFVLLAAAYVPGNLIQARIRHPMAAGITLWAAAHLMVNGNRHHLLLFGSFLLWSVLSFLAARRRDQRDQVPATRVKKGATGSAVAIGVAAWIGFTLWLHGLLIGVRPFG